MVTQAYQCAGNLNITKVLECADGELGSQLLAQKGMITENYSPALNWVPWLIVNGEHNDQIQFSAEKDLVNFLCKMFNNCPTKFRRETKRRRKQPKF